MEMSTFRRIIIKLLLQFKYQNNMADSLHNKLKRDKSPTGALDKHHLDTIITLNDKVIAEAIKEHDNNSALSLLSQLQSTIKTGNYGTYSSNKKHFYYHMFVCLYNKALTHQDKGDSPKARQSMGRAIESYQKLQGFITSREQNLVFSGQMVKLQLQYCGLLSHCNMYAQKKYRHQQATTLAQKCLDRIIESARILQAVCYEQAIFNAQRETTCSSREKGSRCQFVDFKSLVIEEAQNMLQELSALSPVHKLVGEDKEKFKTVIARIFAWKENEQNNETAIRKELKVKAEKSTRSLLGLQRQTIQNEYEIGSFMTCTFKNMSYAPHPDPLRLLSTHHLRQMAFHSAVAYFTMATETRFSQSDLSQIRSSLKIDQKYKKLNHDQRMLKCKILHLKGLEVAGRLLPAGSALFAHLAQSFCRNYKFVMDQIGQVSQINSTHHVEKHNPNPPKDQISVESEYGIKMVPSRRSYRQSTKLDKSKSRYKERQGNRSKSLKKMRSQSGRKKKDY